MTIASVPGDLMTRCLLRQFGTTADRRSPPPASELLRLFSGYHLAFTDARLARAGD